MKTGKERQVRLREQARTETDKETGVERLVKY